MAEGFCWDFLGGCILENTLKGIYEDNFMNKLN